MIRSRQPQPERNSYNNSRAHFHRSQIAPGPKDTCLPRRYAPLLTAMILLWSAVLVSGSRAGGIRTASGNGATPGRIQRIRLRRTQLDPVHRATAPQLRKSPHAVRRFLGTKGRSSRSIQLPGVPERDREHLLQLLPQKAGEPLDRGRVRDSIRRLYATGRFADIQAEVAPSGDGVSSTFTTSANFFVGAVDVEGAPTRPTPEPDRQRVEVSVRRTLYPATSWTARSRTSGN